MLLRLPMMGKRKGDAGQLEVRMRRPLLGELRSVTVRLDCDWLRGQHLHKAPSCTKRGSANRRKAARALGRHKSKEARRSAALLKATRRLAKDYRLTCWTI
ncbi:hypothetical protein [Roseomonas sp. USHLN139]|uniref:hypothetical protein n=1 Tax=Roseomonas sp. USHLN139 TaxID=3081298 RepID=UPI003B01AC14